MIDSISRMVVGLKKQFDGSCDKVGDFLDRHPSLYKAVLVVSHLFRAMTMWACLVVAPTAPLVTAVVLLAPSLLYRAAIERFCVFRFTLVSLIGAEALRLGNDLLTNPFRLGLATIAVSCFCVAYFGLICYISHTDIEKRMADIKQNKGCCSR